MGSVKRMRQDIAGAGCGVLGLFCPHDGALALVDARGVGLVDRRGFRAGIGSRLVGCRRVGWRFGESHHGLVGISI